MTYTNTTRETERKDEYKSFRDRFMRYSRPVSLGLAGTLLATTIGCANVRPMLSAFSSEAGGTEIRAGFVIGEDNQSVDFITDKQGNRFSVEEESFWDTRTGKVVKYTAAVLVGLAGGKLISDYLNRDKGHDNKTDETAVTPVYSGGGGSTTPTVTPKTPPPSDPPPSDPPPEEERER